MNTSGWIRGLISHNSPNKKFVEYVTNTISQEFGLPKKVHLGNVSYAIELGRYMLDLKIKDAMALQETGPYALDKYLLNNLKNQGLSFSLDRSQYIQYCYGRI